MTGGGFDKAGGVAETRADLEYPRQCTGPGVRIRYTPEVGLPGEEIKRVLGTGRVRRTKGVSTTTERQIRGRVSYGDLFPVRVGISKVV
jgi:hypothetical protein